MLLHVYKSTMDFYADDSTLSSSSNWKTISSLNQTLSDDLAEIERWAGGNKLGSNCINTLKLKESFVGYGKASTQAYEPRFWKVGSCDGYRC